MKFPDSDEIMIVNGKKMTREDMGNYTYGYFGSAMGIDDYCKDYSDNLPTCGLIPK